ncbi:carboxymuconolactone decarboxylase family protein [Aneurinibacillus sp. Ricciae_BoGa-3]|uniref:carboxymuconolactone decarboxylase family protein n=1 Tax=Aneurinibacillus sp. Ricciae_BoGa-3 TaxID=3022697 RepID=UPI0023421BC8|nr:carboxymuconolactone decarboxylase family protein [Aneurinibacillus sp. Ricciae_BoGa-3]WCK52462.1 carboxymuconolactone decarboxylase family protein [Aneurinibacillus sp. Ricciae_BoGa-3]
MENRSRFEMGLQKLAEVDGKAGEEVVAPLGDLGRYIVEFAFGDIYSRDGLSLREREIATVAMLTVMGGRDPQLRVHIGAALNVGLTAEEIEEVIIQTVPYGGFPTAINALCALKEITAETV